MTDVEGMGLEWYLPGVLTSGRAVSTTGSSACPGNLTTKTATDVGRHERSTKSNTH